MDWFSWLSKTTLVPSLIYQYGVVFSRNELQSEDICHFDHEVLQSMGISVAKHRLEILQLARKVNGGWREKSGILSAFRKTRKGLRKCLNKFGFQEEEEEEDLKRKRSMAAIKERGIAFSGPLDGKRIERLLITRSPKLSGPLDGKGRSPTRSEAAHARTLQDWFVGPNKSPRVSGSLVCSHCNKERVEFEGDDSRLWASLFQDMKPT